MPDSHPELPVDSDSPAPVAGPLHLRFSAIALVALGGVLGTAARYSVGHLNPTAAGHWPVATFSVNLLGAFLLGFLLEGLARLGPDSHWRQRVRLCLGTGLLGSFTTYSALADEVDLLLRDGHLGLGAGYAAATVVLGMLATGVGIAVGSRVRKSSKGAIQ